MKSKVIVIVGPTASGKTKLSIEIAKNIGGEIISADSRQVYRGLDIGSGKVTPAEQEGVVHHMLDNIDPREVFTAAAYVRVAERAISDVIQRGKTPLIVGGTGFYIDALLGRRLLANVPPNHAMRKELSKVSLEELQEKLRMIAPERFKTIDQKNPMRLIRAIEIASSPGTPPTDDHREADSPLYEALWLGLTLPPLELKERIEARLMARLNAGMLAEARRLLREGVSFERMEALGLEYRFMARHLRGMISHEEMVEILRIEIFKYAKRQMTWFKQNKDIRWITRGDTEKATCLVQEFLS